MAQKQFEQVKINIPKSNKTVIAYCRRLSGQRLLSKRVVRLLSDDLSKKKN